MVHRFKSITIEEFEAIIENSYDGIVICNKDGKFERVNAAYERITGIKREEVLGKRGKDLVKKGILSDYLADRVTETQKPIAIMQTYKTGKNAMIIGSPIFNKNGEISKIVFNVRDITKVNLLKSKLNEKTELSRRYQTEVEVLRREQIETAGFISQSKSMAKVLELAKTIARVDSTILLLGETGVGKGEVARTIHKMGPRCNKPFIKINCGAIPDSLLESELFGYEMGAFSGAKREGKPGMFELAHQGTLLLDEIAELPLSLQVKLLQVLQEREFIRVGGTKHIKVDVRIIAATNRNLQKMVSEGRFREDIYYRLNVVPIVVSPLRERPEDIIPLAQHFISKLELKYEVKKKLSPETANILQNYKWPGNVRELENIIERLIITTQGDTIEAKDLPENLCYKNKETGVTINNVLPLKDAIEQVEKKIITMAFEQCQNTYEVAKVLRISQPTAYRKIKRYISKT